jgi:hypothetical protein
LKKEAKKKKKEKQKRGVLLWKKLTQNGERWGQGLRAEEKNTLIRAAWH